MKRYALSEAADADLLHIITDSAAQWGLARAERYILEMHEAFENLATFPGIARNVRHLRDGYLEFFHNSHRVLYQKTGDGILIVRVLHQKQQPAKHVRRFWRPSGR